VVLLIVGEVTVVFVRNFSDCVVTVVFIRSKDIFKVMLIKLLIAFKGLSHLTPLIDCKCPENCDFEVSFVGFKKKKGEAKTSHQLVSLNYEHFSTCRSKNIKGISYSEGILVNSIRSFMEEKIRKGKEPTTVISSGIFLPVQLEIYVQESCVVLRRNQTSCFRYVAY
jgi:hypothetical protein